MDAKPSGVFAGYCNIKGDFPELYIMSINLT